MMLESSRATFSPPEAAAIAVVALSIGGVGRGSHSAYIVTLLWITRYNRGLMNTVHNTSNLIRLYAEPKLPTFHW